MACGVQFYFLLLICCDFLIIPSVVGNIIPLSHYGDSSIDGNSSSINRTVSSEHESGLPQDTSEPVFMEGGHTVVTSSRVNQSTSGLGSAIDGTSVILSDGTRSNPQSDIYTSLDAGTTSNHNHVSKARKGVDVNETILEVSTEDHVSSELKASLNTQPILLKSVSTVISNNSNMIAMTKILPSELHFNSNDPFHLTTKQVEIQNFSLSNSTKGSVKNSTLENSTISSTLRPKPEFTRDDSDADNQSSFPFSSESDYVIPIVAIVFAAPLLAILGMVLYKRSKEFWERRHYRRMDFLIDGMYND